MTTDIEIYALEDGDTIVYRGEHYTYLHTASDVHGKALVHCVDAEGFRHCITAEDDFQKIRILVIDNSEAVV